MATLKKVTEQLQANKEAQDETTEEVGGVKSRLTLLLTSFKLQNMRMLEALRERGTGTATAAAGTAAAGESGGLGFLARIPALGALGTTLAAIGASIVGLDDALRGLKIAQVATDFAKAIGRGVAAVGRLGSAIADAFRTLLLVVPALQDAFRAIIKNVPDGIKAGFDNLRSNILTTIPESFARIRTSITTFFEPITNFFGRIRAVFGTVTQGIGTTVELAGNVIRPIVGFFQQVFTILEPLLKPLKFLLQTALRPFFQIVLSIVDFVTGFFKGFTGEEGNILDKLGAGLEGGIKGVIKGITEAIDLILFRIPAFLLDKIGFDRAAATVRDFNLTELVDPLFEDVKKFLRDAFTGNLELPTFSIGDTGDTTKSILRAVLPPPQPFDLFKPASYPSNFIPDEVYEYAGINPQTGETIAPPPIASAPVDGGLAAAAAATATGAGTPNQVIVSDSSVKSTRGGDSNVLVTNMAATFDQTDRYMFSNPGDRSLN